jgi:hypothetical protein
MIHSVAVWWTTTVKAIARYSSVILIHKSHADWKAEIDKSKETLFHVWNRQIEFDFDELVFLKRNLQKLSATV